MNLETMNSWIFGSNSTSRTAEGISEDSLSTVSLLDDDASVPKAEPLSVSSSSFSDSSCSTAASSSAFPERCCSVAFKESANVYHTNTLYADDEVPELWFSAQDYAMFKAASSATARTIFRSEGGDEGALEHTFTGELENAYYACYDNEFGLNARQRLRLEQLFRDELHLMKAAVNNDHSLCKLGLERRACRAISRDKTRCRQELVRIIYAVQLASTAATTDELENTSARDEEQLEREREYVEQELAYQCESMTRASQLFARFLAQALWDAEQ